jgi:hypothetical protein
VTKYLPYILIFFSLIAGAALYKSIDNHFRARELRKEFDIKIKAYNIKLEKTVFRLDSIRMDFNSYKAGEATGLIKQDSINQLHGKKIKSITGAVWNLKQNKNELLEKLDSIKRVTDLPDL